MWKNLIALAAVALAGCSVMQDKSAAEAAVVQFHRLLDEARFHDIYDGADPEFRRSGDEGRAIIVFDTVHERLGRVRRTEQRGWRVDFTSDGNVVQLDYATEFERGQAVENFAFRVRAGRASLIGYHANSPALSPIIVPVEPGPREGEVPANTL